MTDSILRRLIRAAIEHFPMEKTRKQEILRRILREIGEEKR